MPPVIDTRCHYITPDHPRPGEPRKQCNRTVVEGEHYCRYHRAVLNWKEWRRKQEGLTFDTKGVKP